MGMMMEHMLFDAHAKTLGDFQAKFVSTKDSMTQGQEIVKKLVKERDKLERSETMFNEAHKKA